MGGDQRVKTRIEENIEHWRAAYASWCASEHRVRMAKIALRDAEKAHHCDVNALVELVMFGHPDAEAPDETSEVESGEVEFSVAMLMEDGRWQDARAVASVMEACLHRAVRHGGLWTSREGDEKPWAASSQDLDVWKYSAGRFGGLAAAAALLGRPDEEEVVRQSRRFFDGDEPA